MVVPDSASARRARVVARHVVECADTRLTGCICCPTSTSQQEAADDQLVSLPIFSLQPVLPASEEVFHIFEPRYRLLLTHCLEKLGPAGQTGEFGMCWPVPGESAGTFSDTGTLLRVTSHVPHPDGRSDIRCVGVRRFRVLRRGSERGVESSTNTVAEYPIADIEWFEDDDEQGASEAAVDGEVDKDPAGSLMCRQLLVAFHDALLRAYPSPEAKVFLLRMHGPDVYKELAASLDEGRSVQAVIDAPSEDDPFTWWVLNKVAVLPPSVKAGLVLSQSVSKRLEGATALLERMAKFFAEMTPAASGMGLVDGLSFKETEADPDDVTS